MEDPETGFKSNILGEQPEDVSEEIFESCLELQIKKYSENGERYS